MNGNVYILFPYAKFGLTPNAPLEINSAVSNTLYPYYKTKLRVSCVDDPGAQAIKVYIMDPPVYPNSDTAVREAVCSTLKAKIPNLSAQMIELRLNYAQFNPRFQPDQRKMPVQTEQNVTQERPSGGLKKTMDEVREKVSDALQQEKTGRRSSKTEEFDYEKLSLNYTPTEPRFSFDQVILPKKTLEQIERAIGILEVEHKVFDEWGLRSIIPEANSALSFYGPPGTGKSMAAEAIAQKLGKKILSATYADIESKFHGEGPKMVKAIFMAAERENAVLFLDESDSLLSKRLTNVSDGSAQAINSMRSQLLTSLERFKGIVIFATNLVVNYDKAFLSRLLSIEFTMPDAEERQKIWWQHLKTDTIHVPLHYDVDVRVLAEKYEFCGREIRNAVKSACIATALDKRSEVTQIDLLKACELTKEESLKVTSASDHTLSIPVPSSKQEETMKEVMQRKIDTMRNTEAVDSADF